MIDLAISVVALAAFAAGVFAGLFMAQEAK